MGKKFIPSVAKKPASGWPPDQYTGIGGNYVRDPVTGVRTPAPTIPNTAADDASRTQPATGEK